MLQDNGWFRTLQRDNVELVNEGIARVTEHGVVTTSGDEHPADVLILATGFHPNKFLWPMEITGARCPAPRRVGRGPARLPRHHDARLPEPVLPLRSEHQPGRRAA